MKKVYGLLLAMVLLPVGFFVTFLPRRSEPIVASILGRFLYLVLFRRRLVVSQNLAICFPTQSIAFRNRLLHDNFRHYGFLVLELLHMMSPVPGHWVRYAKSKTKLVGMERFLAAAQKGKGVLFVSSHLGNWELMVAAGTLAGIRLTMVTKHLKPEWFHEWMERTRASTGAAAAYEPRTLPVVMRALKKGEAVGFVMDQFAGPPMGVEVPFFGIPVGTLAAVGTLVARTGAVVVMAKTVRNAHGDILVTIEGPFDDVEEMSRDAVRCTAWLTAAIERWIRETPEQWYWIHRRFKQVNWDKLEQRAVDGDHQQSGRNFFSGMV